MIPSSRPDIGEAEEQAVLEVLRSGMLAMGAKPKAFEEAWAAYCGVRHAIMLSNGTVAQEAVLQALGIGEGDEVEFAVHDDGTVTVRGYVSIPTDQAWFFTPEWLAGEREADEEIAAGRGTVHESAEDMFAHLDSLDSPDE